MQFFEVYSPILGLIHVFFNYYFNLFLTLLYLVK